MAVLTDYQDVLGAVADYYGTGSDQWVSFAKYGMGANNLEQTLSQVPGVNIYKNNAGKISGYSYENPFAASNSGTAGDLNSNLQVPTQGDGTTFKGNIPASGDYSGAGNTANLSSGAKSTATGATVSTVLTRVTTGIAAVASGARLGANIAQSLYNGNPDYWDDTFPTLNPQTWDTIAGSNELGKSVINAIFGIDKSNNRTQMYIPEDAFAYLAYAMAHEGFFSGDGYDFPDYQDTGEVEITSAASAQEMFNVARSALPRGISSISTNAQRIIDNFMAQFGSMPGISFCTHIDGSFSGYSPLSVSAFRDINIGDTITLTTTYRVAVLALSGVSGGASEPFRITDAQISYRRDTPYIGTRDITDDYQFSGFNAVPASAKEGVEKQEGATYPDTTNWDTPENAKSNIRTQYPDLYNNSIYTDVPQPDGTTERIIYYPVNMTSTSGSEDTTPTNTTVNYNNTYVDNNSSEDLLKTVLRYLYQTQTETKNDTPDPPNTPNPTDTGTGNTPPVVMPTGNASALWTVYNPTQAQLNSFGAWLWSSNFIDQILKLFNDPMQSIIGIHKIFASPSISGSNNITVGYLDSGVTANVVGAQYTSIDCGSVKVQEQFGNVFDYEDTQIRLYLPFIGIVQLDTSDVMRGTVSIVYHVDVITGACLAEVKIARDSGGGTLYQFSGDAAVRYPISSGSYMGVVSGVLGVVGGIASGIMSGGATLPIAAGAIAGGLSGAKTQVQHSGSFAGNAGAMGGKKPYLIIERPQTAVADGFENYQGTGANRVALVSSMSGYFKMTDIHTDSITGAAESEIEAIRAALAGGVIA